ncbi:hypothetical protein D3C85_1352340 [compost metagenome]
MVKAFHIGAPEGFGGVQTLSAQPGDVVTVRTRRTDRPAGGVEKAVIGVRQIVEQQPNRPPINNRVMGTPDHLVCGGGCSRQQDTPLRGISGIKPPGPVIVQIVVHQLAVIGPATPVLLLQGRFAQVPYKLKGLTRLILPEAGPQSGVAAHNL